MASFADGVARYIRYAAQPPMWMRVAIVPLFALVAWSFVQHRGWLVGLVAAVVYGSIGVAVALNPAGVRRWSRRHPEVDGAMLGPLVFLAFAGLTHLSLWWCLLAGVTGIALGAARGDQRGRRWRQAADPDGH